MTYSGLCAGESAREGAVDATMTELPTGTVTFMLTDIAGSTHAWEHDELAAGVAVARHYALLDEAAAAHSGIRPLEQGEGDSTVSVFEHAGDAVAQHLMRNELSRGALAGRPGRLHTSGPAHW